MNTELKNLAVCVGKGGQKDIAESFARKTGAAISDKPGEELTLMFDSHGIYLTGYGLSFQGDFEQMLHRITEGRLYHEMLVHITKTQKENPAAVDATAGMGEDSVLLAAAGYNVTMYEQNPVIALLLKDALRRGKKNLFLKDILSRMTLVEGNSIDLMKELPFTPDIIYLDPMFPARKKSGLVNKKLQLIQKLEQPCVDEVQLLQSAKELNAEKIIIKRPLKGAFLAGEKPDYSIKGKAIRYDCIKSK